MQNALPFARYFPDGLTSADVTHIVVIAESGMYFVTPIAYINGLRGLNRIRDSSGSRQLGGA